MALIKALVLNNITIKLTSKKTLTETVKMLDSLLDACL